MRLCSFFVLCTFGVFAQDKQTENSKNTLPEASENYELSLDKAKELALEYNYDLKNAGISIQEAAAAKWEAISKGLPQVNAAVDYSTFFGASSDFMGQAIEFNNTSNLNANVSQLIFSGAYFVGLKMAKLNEEISSKAAEKTELEVKQQVSDAYYSILLAEKTSEILKKNLENIKKVHKQTEKMYQAGVAELTDVDQLSLQVTVLESSWRASERQTEMAYDMLKLQVGLKPTADLKLTQTLEEFFNPDNFYNSLMRVFDAEENLDYQLLEQQTEMSEKQISLAKTEYLPTLSAAFNHLEQIIAPNFNMNPKNSLTFNLSIPIFSSGQRKAKVNQAKYQHEKVKNQKEQLSDQLLTQDRSIKRNLRTALDQYDANKKNVTVAKRVYDNINRKYEAGMVSSLDLTTANNNYLAAEGDYIQAMLDVLTAYLELDKFYKRL